MILLCTINSIPLNFDNYIGSTPKESWLSCPIGHHEQGTSGQPNVPFRHFPDGECENV